MVRGIRQHGFTGVINSRRRATEEGNGNERDQCEAGHTSQSLQPGHDPADPQGRARILPFHGNERTDLEGADAIAAETAHLVPALHRSVADEPS